MEFIIIILALFIYFIPTLTASMRDSGKTFMVFVVNLFLGWSLVGWVVALVMACATEGNQTAKQSAKVSQNSFERTLYNEQFIELYLQNEEKHDNNELLKQMFLNITAGKKVDLEKLKTAVQVMK
ncbi:hypothetical protein GCE9029_01186 [Grimontia celer]|uniref:Superinfection immunity protein n=1 Tax=Grimontia celer TaxID=1796497 RepID=A0A128EY82_9GAMM|nr:superinfection immunity protein [Grimontia celer]CZF78991.1 hypothetical protein GCE9029_01186 [Grimontia celer]